MISITIQVLFLSYVIIRDGLTLLFMMQPDFNPFPELKTERLLLRRITEADAAAVFFLRSDKKILEFIGKEAAVSITEAENFIRNINHDTDANEVILWGIAIAENPSVIIGTICYWRLQKEHYRAEIGYVLHPGYWRRGIMREAILKVLDYGFEQMKLHSIEARIQAENAASAALLENIGFVKEGYLKEEFYFREKFYDTILYSRIQ